MKDQTISRFARWKMSVKRGFARFEDFFLRPSSPLPLAVMRVALGVLLLVQVYLLRDSVIPFLSRDGLVQGPLADAMRMTTAPHVGWLADLLKPFGVSEAACVYGVCAAYITSLIFFSLGLFTRAASIATWFMHWVLMVTGFSTAYGVDLYAHVFLFYLMWMPSGGALSLDAYFAGSPLSGVPSWTARLGLRVLQIHLCISYASSAWEKIQGVQWRTGEVLWRTLSLPLFQQFDMNWIAHWPSLLFIGSWATLILEGLFFIFIWPRRTRYSWLAGMLGLHLGIAIFMGLHLFGFIMCILVLSTFAVPAEPRPFALRAYGFAKADNIQAAQF